jgi:hypothetical protein
MGNRRASDVSVAFYMPTARATIAEIMPAVL